MKKVLYTKYNSFRKKEYQIKTTLFEENGKKYINKKALNKDAIEHIERIRSNGKALDKVYKIVKILPSKIDADEIVFDFVQGKTLLDEVGYDLKDIDELVSVVKEKLDIVFDIDDSYIKKFELSDEFSKVFPDCVPDSLDAYSVSNIDSNLDNFIRCGDDIYSIDYEWVFDFDIPIEYLKYRVLYYFYEQRKAYIKRLVGLEDFIDRFGISRNEQSLYYQMELCFQRFVNKPNGDYWYPVDYYKESISLDDILDENKRLKDVASEVGNLRDIINKQNVRIEEMRRSVRNPIYGVKRLIRNRTNK